MYTILVFKLPPRETTHPSYPSVDFSKQFLTTWEFYQISKKCMVLFYSLLYITRLRERGFQTFRSRMQHLQREGKYESPILPVCWPKFMRFWNSVGGSLTPFSDCLRDVSVQRNSPLSIEIAEKRPKVQFCGRRFSGRMTPKVVWHFSAVYTLPFGKVRLRSVCWPPCAKLGDEVACRIYGGWVKWTSYFKPFIDHSSSWNFEKMQETVVVFNAVCYFRLLEVLAASQVPSERSVPRSYHDQHGGRPGRVWGQRR